MSPQARGRLLARLGQRLWQDLGSVKLAAGAVMAEHPDVPSLQAFRYAAGLSQDQAAARYNEVAGFATSLGGTTINAWETWARGRSRPGGPTGSPPPFSSLVILAEAYGRGPLGVSDEELSPADLVAEAYERLPPEDQLALKRHTTSRPAPKPAEPTGGRVPLPGPASAGLGNVIGPDFTLEAPTVPHGNPALSVFTLPNPTPGQLVDLSWPTFGFGIERLCRQIKNVGRRVEVDLCVGVNEAGLVMATFLASAQFGRCPIGYLKCLKNRDDIALADESHFPEVRQAPAIMICDFEVKHADVVGFVAGQLRQRYPGCELYFAVFGAMTKNATLDIDSFDELTGATIMRKAGFAAVFIGATMSPPGIEPPLELR